MRSNRWRQPLRQRRRPGHPILLQAPLAMARTHMASSVSDCGCDREFHTRSPLGGARWIGRFCPARRFRCAWTTVLSLAGRGWSPIHLASQSGLLRLCLGTHLVRVQGRYQDGNHLVRGIANGHGNARNVGMDVAREQRIPLPTYLRQRGPQLGSSADRSLGEYLKRPFDNPLLLDQWSKGQQKQPGRRSVQWEPAGHGGCN